MKDVRNAKLRKILDKMGIKDVVLNFSGGSVLVCSDDDTTDLIFAHADNTIHGVHAFSDWSIDMWVDEITRIFDEALDVYESGKSNDNYWVDDEGVVHLGVKG